MHTITKVASVTLFSLLFASTVSFAKDKKWSNETELSYVETGGNTDLKTLSAKNSLKYKLMPRLEGTFKGGVLFAKNDGKQTSEKYSANLRLDYSVTKRFYASLNTGWLSDRFAGIDSRYYLGPVAGYKILDGQDHLLAGEGGVDYVKENYPDDTSKSFMRGRAFLQYDYIFSPKTKFTQTVEYLYDFDNPNNYNYNLVSALISSLNDNFSLKTSYERRYDNETVAASPDKNVEKTDTVIAVTLVINYN